MPAYLLRVVHRAGSGEIGPTLHEVRIEAASPAEAIARARALDLDLAAHAANAVYLTDADGRPLWSLHAPPAPDR